MQAVKDVATHKVQRRRLQRALLWCLLVSLPLVGLSSTLTQLLGPRHFHATSAVPQRIVGWLRQVPLLAELRQIREETTRAHVHTHHSHGYLSRHHHPADDDSVVLIDRAIPEDSAGADPGSTADPHGPVWAFTAGPHTWVLGGLSDAWPERPTSDFRSIDPARRDRPPKG